MADKEKEKLNDKTEIETIAIEKQPVDETTKKVDVLLKFKGFLYVSFGCFFNTFQSYFMRKAYFFNGVEQTFIRYFVQVIMLAIIALYCKVGLLGPKEFRVYINE